MRRIGEFMGEIEEGTGSLILGSKTRGCIYCGAAPVPEYSGCGRVVWWHPPTDCCAKRRAAQVGPNRKAESSGDYTPSNLAGPR